MFLYDPDRVEELAQKFINDWCSKNGKVVRFYTNRIKWKSEIPELAPFIKKFFNLLIVGD